jgi:hypothetical protein
MKSSCFNSQIRPLNVPLLAPFTIATTIVRDVRNVAVMLRLTSGVSNSVTLPAMN